MKNPSTAGNSFESGSLGFRGAFHSNRIHQQVRPKPKVEEARSKVFARFEKAVERKLAYVRRRLEEKDVKREENPDIHEYEYKEFADEPEIEFSPVSLLLLGPVLLCINISIAQHEEIEPVQFVFVAMLITFVYNLVFILRKNRLMPFLPTKAQDDRLKLAAVLTSVGLCFCLTYGWNASGGMIFAIVWESLAGRQGCFYLIIFGAIIGGSITMEWASPEYALRLAPSILFGIVAVLLRGLPTNSPYAICNQISLFLVCTSSWLYPFMPVSSLDTWQYIILLMLGLSCYFNLLLIIKLMQTQNTSMAMAVTTGILIISTTSFTGVSDYVACLTITLSILVLIKLEYLDKRD